MICDGRPAAHLHRVEHYVEVAFSFQCSCLLFIDVLFMLSIVLQAQRRDPLCHSVKVGGGHTSRLSHNFIDVCNMSNTNNYSKYLERSLDGSNDELYSLIPSVVCTNQ